MSFRVEPVGPERMRLYLDTGAEKATVQASGITLTTGPGGTTITGSGPVTVTRSDGKKLSFEGLTLRLTPGGIVWVSLAPVGNK